MLPLTQPRLPLVLFASLFVACATTQARHDNRDSQLSSKIGADIFIEYGVHVDLMAGARAARYRDGRAYMPVEIAVANHGLRTFVVTRQSFALVDETGARYTAAGPRELLQNYRLLDMDREAFAELAGAASSTFGGSRRHPSKFSPTRGIVSADRLALNVVRDTVLLPRFGYVVDFIYFPKPATGIKGHRFDLTLASDEPGDSVTVRFAVN